MTTGVRCESCGTFSPHADGWLFLIQPRSAVDPQSILASLGGGREDPPTLCSVLCLAEWAYVQAMVNGAPTGVEPPTRAGTGWPT